MSAAKTTKVAVVVSHLTIGGAEQLLLELLRHLDRERFTCALFFLRQPGLVGEEVVRLGFPVTTGIISSKLDPGGIFRLARHFKEFGADTVFLINHLNSLFYAVPAARLAGVRKVINWENETFKRYPWHWLTMLGRRLLHLGVDYVVAAAQGHGEYIAEEEKIPRQKIRVIYNGVDISRFQSSLTPGEAKRRLGIKEESPVVSIVAALRPDKAHHVFIAAAAQMIAKRPDIYFLIIGDGPERARLEGLTRELGLEKKVIFLGFQRQLGDILAAVEVNCLSSYPQQETLSVAAIEAMSAGVPMVCTDVGFMREIVIPGETGFLVPVDHPQALAEKLLEIIGNSALRDRMGKRASALVHEKLSIGRMTRDFEDLIACRD
jgi:glycosyltransferase involved in cell wall biosynthesis